MDAAGFHWIVGCETASRVSSVGRTSFE